MHNLPNIYHLISYDSEGNSLKPDYYAVVNKPAGQCEPREMFFETIVGNVPGAVEYETRHLKAKEVLKIVNDQKRAASEEYFFGILKEAFMPKIVGYINYLSSVSKLNIEQ